MLRGPGPDPDPRGRPDPTPKRPKLYRGLEAEALRPIPETGARRGRYGARVLSEALQGWKDLEAEGGHEPLSHRWLRRLKHLIATISILITFGFVALTLMVVSRTSVLDASLHLEPCPEGWMYSRKICFFFSDVAKPWGACDADCSSHDASLAVIPNEETLNFILSRIDTQTYWIGLRKRGDVLSWVNGESYTGTLLGVEASGECAFIQSPTISLSRCGLPRNWICTKEPYKS
ncbi:C-type lectin domain family 2 member D-like [Lissotriton helveticus]